MKSSRWVMVVLGVIAFLMVGTAVWASPPASEPSIPPLATPGLDADKVDGHHAVVSNAPRSQRKNKLLWALSNGKLSSKVLPMTQLDNRYVNDNKGEVDNADIADGALSPAKILGVAWTAANHGQGSGLDADLLDGQDSTAFAGAVHNHDEAYLNDDRQETIEAAVEGNLLSVNNTGTGINVRGLYAFAEDYAVYGDTTSGYGVYGISLGGYGVYGGGGGSSSIGVFGYSSSGLPVKAGGTGGSNLIEAWDLEPYTDDLRFKVTRSGDVRADGTIQGGGADFAEMMATSEGVTYEPGDLLVIGPDGKPLLSSAPNATNLLGVYSTDPGFVGGVGEDGEIEGKIPVAITGVVSVKASAENGAILPGDLLTSSSIPGHAMKASPVAIDGVTFYLPGTILGKALEALEEGRAVILVLVTLQ